MEKRSRGFGFLTRGRTSRNKDRSAKELAALHAKVAIRGSRTHVWGEDLPVSMREQQNIDQNHLEATDRAPIDSAEPQAAVVTGAQTKGTQTLPSETEPIEPPAVLGPPLEEVQVDENAARRAGTNVSKHLSAPLLDLQHNNSVRSFDRSTIASSVGPIENTTDGAQRLVQRHFSFGPSTLSLAGSEAAASSSPNGSIARPRRGGDGQVSRRSQSSRIVSPSPGTHPYLTTQAPTFSASTPSVHRRTPPTGFTKNPSRHTTNSSRRSRDPDALISIYGDDEEGEDAVSSIRSDSLRHSASMVSRMSVVSPGEHDGDRNFWQNLSSCDLPDQIYAQRLPAALRGGASGPRPLSTQTQSTSLSILAGAQHGVSSDSVQTTPSHGLYNHPMHSSMLQISDRGAAAAHVQASIYSARNSALLESAYQSDAGLTNAGTTTDDEFDDAVDGAFDDDDGGSLSGLSEVNAGFSDCDDADEADDRAATAAALPSPPPRHSRHGSQHDPVDVVTTGPVRVDLHDASIDYD